MTTAAPRPTPATAAADDWLSSLDDVLGPDDGASVPRRSEIGLRPWDAMRWSADAGNPVAAHPVTIEMVESVRERMRAYTEAMERARSITVPVAAPIGPNLASLYGVPLRVDPTMQPGTMELGSEVRAGLDRAADTIARFLAGLRPKFEAAGRALTRLAAAMRTPAPPPPSRLDRSRQQRIATAIRRRDRRTARRHRHAACRTALR